MMKMNKHTIIIDEAIEMSENDWKKLGKFAEKLKKMKGVYIVGTDFAKGKGTACIGHINKKGEFVINKITEI